MTTPLHKIIHKIKFGYVFMFFTINLFYLPVVGRWLGFVFFACAIKMLAEYDPDTAGLQSVAVFGVFVEFIGRIVMLAFISNPLIAYIIAILRYYLRIYVNYKLITSLCGVLTENGYDAGKLNKFRNILIYFDIISLVLEFITFAGLIPPRICTGWGIIHFLTGMLMVVTLGGYEKQTKAGFKPVGILTVSENTVAPPNENSL